MINGYTHRYKKETKCDLCKEAYKVGGWSGHWLLFEYNGKKICQKCAKEKRII